MAVCSTSNEKAVGTIVRVMLGPEIAAKMRIFAGGWAAGPPGRPRTAAASTAWRCRGVHDDILQDVLPHGASRALTHTAQPAEGPSRQHCTIPASKTAHFQCHQGTSLQLLTPAMPRPTPHTSTHSPHLHPPPTPLPPGDVVPKKKPDPAIYLLAAKELGVDPARCCVVEDSGIGLKAAKAAGMR